MSMSETLLNPAFPSGGVSRFLLTYHTTSYHTTPHPTRHPPTTQATGKSKLVVPSTLATPFVSPCPPWIGLEWFGLVQTEQRRFNVFQFYAPRSALHKKWKWGGRVRGCEEEARNKHALYCRDILFYPIVLMCLNPEQNMNNRIDLTCPRSCACKLNSPVYTTCWQHFGKKIDFQPPLPRKR